MQPMLRFLLIGTPRHGAFAFVEGKFLALLCFKEGGQAGCHAPRALDISKGILHWTGGGLTALTWCEQAPLANALHK
jgi:hypothetical protein